MTPEIRIRKLSHVGLLAQNPEAQAAFYRDFVGLTETARDETGRIYLRCNNDHHQIVLVPAEENGMDHYALEVKELADLEAAQEQLLRAGIECQTNFSTELGHEESIRFRDPLGFNVELVTGLSQLTAPSGIRTVRPRKFQHITLRAPKFGAGFEFYTKVLGLRVSDWVGDDFVWMRCSPDHHGLAISRHQKRSLHHIAFEVRDMAELVQQAEHLAQHDHVLLYGPGRHGPGNNLFIYFHDVDGNIVEFSADMQQIWDDTKYVPKVWNPNERWSNRWGTPASPEFRK